MVVNITTIMIDKEGLFVQARPPAYAYSQGLFLWKLQA